MRRVVIIALGLVATAALIATSASGDGGGDGSYKVRAYFDNAGFLVKGEEVRIAGATVGNVDSVTVSLPGEAVKVNGDEDPGKAVAVLNITDTGFQNFLSDASCLIRPQSLLGEKYVECEPTQPRAPGSNSPPSLDQIPDGQIGAGEFILPLENNGKQVDLDLVNNITRQPEADRFRLILNDLGAGLAARGPDLAAVIERADPALQETDKVLSTLAKQNKQLAQLAADSDAILTPLAAQRQHLAGFVRNAAIAGAASAERSNDIVAGFNAFPNALTELQSTMVQLRKFAEQATPVAVDLNKAAPGLTGATKALRPFSKAGTVALLSLGKNSAAASDDLAASSPVIRQLKKVGETAIPGSRALNKLLTTLRKTGGIDYLMSFILNSSNIFNGFDNIGHYLRTQIQITNCVEYVVAPVPGSGCEAHWVHTPTGTAAPAKVVNPGDAKANSTDSGAADPVTTDSTTDDTTSTTDTTTSTTDTTTSTTDTTTSTTDSGTNDTTSTTQGNQDLLHFLMGNGQ